MNYTVLTEVEVPPAQTHAHTHKARWLRDWRSFAPKPRILQVASWRLPLKKIRPRPPHKSFSLYEPETLIIQSRDGSTAILTKNYHYQRHPIPPLVRFLLQPTTAKRLAMLQAWLEVHGVPLLPRVKKTRSQTLSRLFRSLNEGGCGLFLYRDVARE